VHRWSHRCRAIFFANSGRCTGCPYLRWCQSFLPRAGGLDGGAVPHRGGASPNPNFRFAHGGHAARSKAVLPDRLLVASWGQHRRTAPRPRRAVRAAPPLSPRAVRPWGCWVREEGGRVCGGASSAQDVPS
jgi:hypothetical protein